MKIRINNMDMQYRGSEVSKVKVLYRVEDSDENLSGTGDMSLNKEDYNGDITELENECRNHVVDNIDNMNYEIRSTNMVYDRNEIDSVQVIFKANMDNRELSMRGNFDLSASEYSENSSVEALEDFAKDYIRSKF